MKNTDLMIGNYLQRVDGSIVSVKRLIKDDDDILVNETHGLFTLGYTALPIPLTEEILLKCGFKCNKHGGIFAITEFPSVICIYKDGDTKWNDRYIDCKTLYLHQLQNLYHALTGQELKIEL